MNEVRDEDEGGGKLQNGDAGGRKQKESYVQETRENVNLVMQDGKKTSNACSAVKKMNKTMIKWKYNAVWGKNIQIR